MRALETRVARVQVQYDATGRVVPQDTDEWRAAVRAAWKINLLGVAGFVPMMLLAFPDFTLKGRA